MYRQGCLVTRDQAGSPGILFLSGHWYYTLLVHTSPQSTLQVLTDQPGLD